MSLVSKMQAFNDWVAAGVTRVVSTMWCAYAFAAFSLWGATAVDWSNRLEVVDWASQTFLQLILLSIIMVGQRVLSAASDAQAKEMHDAVMEELALAKTQREEILALHMDIKILLTKQIDP